MKINYNAEDDILVIEFSKDKIVKDLSLNWNVNVGMTENGVGEIVILDAKRDGFLPVELDKAAEVA